VHISNRSKEYLFAHPKENIINHHDLNEAITLYKKEMPLAYIIGSKHFYKDKFFVNKYTLIPRNETESIIETSLDIISRCHSEVINILEIGTGTGCIPISILKHAKRTNNINIIATDISENTLAVARRNAKKLLNPSLEVKLRLILADIIPSRLETVFDIIISNPPYIPSNEIQSLPTSVREFEPIIALDGGKDGKDFYRRIKEKTDILSDNKTIYVFEGYNGLIYTCKKKDLDKTINSMKY